MKSSRGRGSKKRPRSSSPTPGTSNNAGNDLKSTGLVQQKVLAAKEQQSKLNDDATSSPIAKRTRSGLATTSKFKANEFEGQLTIAVEEGQENKVGTFAMQNTEVLEKIAGHFSVDELVTKRQTCRLWNSLMLPELKEQHKSIKLTAADQTKKLEGVQDFTQQMKSSQAIPYNKVEIKNLFTAPAAEFEELFSVFGTSMKSLSVPVSSKYRDNTNNKLNVEDMERLRTIIFELTPELNDLTLAIGENFLSTASENVKRNLTKELLNLRKLTVLRGQNKTRLMFAFDSAFLQPIYRELLADILSNAHNLDTLILEHTTSPTLDRDILAVVRGSLKSIQNIKKLVIKHLKIYELKMLTEMAKQTGNSLQLQEFGTSLQWDNVHAHLVNEDEDENDDEQQNEELLENNVLKFLGTQSSNLKKLKIGLVSRGQVQPSKRLRLPQMPTVLAFSFKIGSPYAPRFPISLAEHGTLEDIFPSLKCFKYKYTRKPSYGCGCGNRFQHNEYTNLQNLSHTGVTDLRLIFSDTPYTPICPILSNFATNFPSVTKLDLILSVDPDEATLMRNVLVICAQWPSLTELRLAFGDVSYGSQDLVNRMLSGVPESRLQDLKQEFLRLAKEKAWTKIPVLRKKYKTEFGLSDLKQLRKFVLNINFYETLKPEDADQSENGSDSAQDDSTAPSDSVAEASCSTGEIGGLAGEEEDGSAYSEEEWSDFESTASSTEDHDSEEADLNLDIGGYIGIAACDNLQHIEISPGGNDEWIYRHYLHGHDPEDPSDGWFHKPEYHSALKTKFVSSECLEFIKASLNPYTFIKL